MGIRFYCPRGHKLNVKAELAGKVGFCPECGQRVLIPIESTRESSHQRKLAKQEGFAPDSEESSLTLHQPPGGLPPGSQFPPEVPGPKSGAPVAEKETASVSPIQPSDSSKASAQDSQIAQNPQIVQNSPTAQDSPAAQKNTQENAWPGESAPNGTLISANIETNPAPASAPLEKPAPSNPIDNNQLLDDPNLVWYARTADGQSYGPVTNVVMKSWLLEKRIGPAMLVWREGWTSWLEARNVFPELEKIFSETPPPKIGETAAGTATGATGTAVSDAAGAEAGDIHFPKSLLEVAGREAESETAHKKTIRKKKKNREVRDLALVLGLIAVILLLVVILVVILMSQSGGESAPKAAETAALILSTAFPNRT